MTGGEILVGIGMLAFLIAIIWWDHRTTKRRRGGKRNRLMDTKEWNMYESNHNCFFDSDEE